MTFTQNIAGNTAAVNPAVSANSNRFTGSDFLYDKNGNVVRDKDPVTNHVRDFVFNGDNKQIEVKDYSAGNQTVAKYFYDGEGKRIKKYVEATGETTLFVYSSGKLVAEYSTAAPPSEPKINYTTTDHLGSPRVITNAIGQVTSRRDFLPFGEELTINVGARTENLNYGSLDNIRQKFTGYQKDTETSLDFAEARMYENRFGRFTAVDPLLASGKSASPQSFNRYVYVWNNPIVDTDLSGECKQRECPQTWSGPVYTDGKGNYDNVERDGFTLFTGDITIRATGAVGGAGMFRIYNFGEGSSGGSGWYRVDTAEREAMRRFFGEFDSAANDKITGMTRGTANFAINAWNSATNPGELYSRHLSRIRLRFRSWDLIMPGRLGGGRQQKSDGQPEA